jgi:hypothetical protein
MRKKKSAGPSREKAKEILRDGTVHGKPITAKQRGYFGSIASEGPHAPRKKRTRRK